MTAFLASPIGAPFLFHLSYFFCPPTKFHVNGWVPQPNFLDHLQQHVASTERAAHKGREAARMLDSKVMCSIALDHTVLQHVFLDCSTELDSELHFRIPSLNALAEATAARNVPVKARMNRPRA